MALFEREVFPGNSLNEHSVGRELEASRCWIAEDQGYVLARWGPELVDILRLGVMPKYQGRGLGRLLLRFVLHAAELPVVLTVRRNNETAMKLYRSEGFLPIGYLPDADALLMRVTSASR